MIDKGIPSNEVAFIHDAKTDIQRKDLFAKVRLGNIRVLLGSTSKMGAGTNVQDLIVALHDLDCPWRPRDLEQRRGRGIRQGNINDTVHVVRYVTEGTFDAYLYQTIEKNNSLFLRFLLENLHKEPWTKLMQQLWNMLLSRRLPVGIQKLWSVVIWNWK